ncbi:uncharacterized protein I206_106180 [Kwoniella pini CBS 10737]|uniref:Uncharacterized protein n=1 Tax=Kwoniella pini CBS 10737 TaxID=1296096 RepID=A0A1B9I1B4_9TREE|nr:uncharacterized protein I206_05005 [Kwoniella pini CBS 10737]OCF49314.1 hypothetical protein I206_05005 [Kwoniella pini CBS 10737]
MSHTPLDDHFISQPDLDLLSHRPHKSAILLFQALTATAVFRIWPSLLFIGGWTTAIVLINEKTKAEMTVPSTLLTALGVLLGLTLSYRTSSAYAQYSEGRKLWTQIIQANRTWARLVWIHCPDAIRASPPDDQQQRAHEETRAVIEKATVVRMGLAFAVAVKHYLRGEEGILYEDLYDLVKFIPSLHLPSGIPSSEDANIAIGRFPSQNKHNKSSSITLNSNQNSISTELKPLNTSKNSLNTSTLSIKNEIEIKIKNKNRPILNPSRNPPKFRFSETFPFKWLVTKKQRYKAQGRILMKEKMRKERNSGGVGQNVPLEITMFMSCFISILQKRKLIDVPTLNSLFSSLYLMSESLSNLERILTTPIPFTYSAHIWEVTWIYCLVLPFQLYDSGFGWITIPAVLITSYIVLGFAEIGSEIENPFGYDKNDLNLDFFTNNIIREELAAITARPFSTPDEWIFVKENDTLGRVGVGADELLERGLVEVRNSLAALSGEKAQHTGLRGRARSPV